MTGLYVHFPFCTKKCDYCDFYSLPDSQTFIPEYLNAILIEASQYKGFKISTFYLGGGTPSIIGSKNLEKLILGLREIFNFPETFEATVEANPDSVTIEFLETAIRLGINRISIGIQSLNDFELKSVGRIHNSQQAIASLKLATKLYKNVSSDLMIGLPGQNWESLEKSISGVLEIGIEHISLYCLSIEHGTKLEFNKPNNLLNDDDQAELFDKSTSFLEKNGFIHYEISNFAKPNKESIHNINYWKGNHYIGLGPNASSHLFGQRFNNTPNLALYIRNPMNQKEGIELLNLKEKSAEEAMLRLRLLKEGLKFNDITNKYGTKATKELLERLRILVMRELLSFDNGIYRIPKHLVLTSNPIFSSVLGLS